MNKFGEYIAGKSMEGPFWTVMKQSGEVIAMRVTSEQNARRIARALDAADQADAVHGRKVEALGRLILQVNADQTDQTRPGEDSEVGDA